MRAAQQDVLFRDSGGLDDALADVLGQRPVDEAPVETDDDRFFFAVFQHHCGGGQRGVDSRGQTFRHAVPGQVDPEFRGDVAYCESNLHFYLSFLSENIFRFGYIITQIPMIGKSRLAFFDIDLAFSGTASEPNRNFNLRNRSFPGDSSDSA